MEDIKQKQELEIIISGDTILAIVELVEQDKVIIKAPINGVPTKLSIKKDNLIKKIQNDQIKFK